MKLYSYRYTLVLVLLYYGLQMGLLWQLWFYSSFGLPLHYFNFWGVLCIIFQVEKDIISLFIIVQGDMPRHMFQFNKTLKTWS